MNTPKDGFDLAGLGKLAKAIPAEVYNRTTKSVLTSFEKLIAPITETTSGFGRYIRQKFDGMVEVEKAIATYTLEEACAKAKAKAAELQVCTILPAHPKMFVKALEEGSKETDPLLHQMWASLLASQMLDGFCHPHFVEILPHFSPSEAKLLVSLRDKNTVGANGGQFMSLDIDMFGHWIMHADDAEPKLWTLSCTLLYEFGFADLLAPDTPVELIDSLSYSRAPILYRTRSGEEFIKAVSV